MSRYEKRKLYFNNRLANLRKELSEEKSKPLMKKGDYAGTNLQYLPKIDVLTFFINRCEEGLKYTEELNELEENHSPNAALIIKTRNDVNTMKKLTHCVKD
jgi:hypothetical protein